jgi:hypothetical protein
MEPPRRISGLLTRLGEAAKGLAAKLRRENPPVEPPPTMIGLPPSARGLKAIPGDIEEHAKDFATRYWEPLEAIARKRMREVGVPQDRIGMIDGDFNYRLAAFHPRQTDGGGVHPPTGRINLDAGIFKPGILEGTMPPEVSLMHDQSRASVKMDEIIAHEYEEGMRGSHEAAIVHAPDTKLTIKEEARRLLRAQRERSV